MVLQKVIKILLVILFALACSDASGKGRTTEIINLQGYEKLKSELLLINNTDILDEWNMLILAICWQESTFKHTTNKNYHGYMQMSRGYVNEVNRLAKTSYTYADARVFKHAVKMHNLINKHRNPNKSINKALKIHNPRTAYHQQVLKKLAIIKQHEQNSKA